MKEGWEIKRLKAVCVKITDGSHNPPKGTDFSEFIMLSSKNIENDHIHYNKPRYLNEVDFLKENKRTQVEDDDVLLTIVGTIGRVAVVPKEYKKFTLQRSVAVLKVEKEEITSRFLMFSLQNILDFLTSESRGVAQKGIYLKQLRELEIPIPPLSEQKQIVALLDKAFTAIDQVKANIKKNIENAKELFQSKLNDIFSQKGEGWEEKTWNEVLEIQSGRNQKAVENPKGKYPIVGSAGKVMNYADDYLCDEGTTIIGRKGTINNPMYMETKFWNVDTAFGLTALKGLDKKFLYFFCLSYDFTKRDKGSGRPSLVKNDLLKIKMPVPQKNIQQSTVVQCEKLNEQLNELIKSYNKKPDLLEDLKKSILQKAFAGELTQNTVTV